MVIVQSEIKEALRHSKVFFPIFIDDAIINQALVLPPWSSPLEKCFRLACESVLKKPIKMLLK